MIKYILRDMMTIMLVISILVCMSSMNVSAVQVQTIDQFEDIDADAYYYEAVSWALKKNMTDGMSASRFGIGDLCSRAQTMLFLWKLNGSRDMSGTENPFSDIGPDDEYYHAVLWGVENGIAAGVSSSRFAPNDTVTRAQFVTFLYRAAGLPDVEGTNPFVDVKADAYYKDPVLWATGNNITNGTSEVTFSPDDICLIEQAITFIWRSEQNSDGVSKDREMTENVIRRELIATERGLSTENTGEENSKILQSTIDYLSQYGGGTIYIPEGEYVFGKNGSQTIGSHCIKMKSDVSIIGEGEKTVLKPTGESWGGLDMFYFNEYVDTGEPVYLKNCTFKDFVIDAENTSCRTYTSAGKGFMFNLFENCHWENVVVKNTVATGFGVDCPLGGSMVNCTAINCGTEANASSPGGAGFGIGFGYSEEEHFVITDCKAYNNKTFGFFFEHQGRFNGKLYQAGKAKLFLVENCESKANNYNYGGLFTMDTIFEACISEESLSTGYYFRDSKNSKVVDSKSSFEGEYGFAIARQHSAGNPRSASNIILERCSCDATPNGVKISNFEDESKMSDIVVKNCEFSSIQEYVVLAEGPIYSLTLRENSAYSDVLGIEPSIKDLVNEKNSWNTLLGDAVASPSFF